MYIEEEQEVHKESQKSSKPKNYEFSKILVSIHWYYT